jgi:hypothetical protein
LTTFFEYQEDDETILQLDEALIIEFERKEELNALQQESELPLDQILKNYKMWKGNEMLLFVQLTMFRLFEQLHNIWKFGRVCNLVALCLFRPFLFLFIMHFSVIFPYDRGR